MSPKAVKVTVGLSFVAYALGGLAALLPRRH